MRYKLLLDQTWHIACWMGPGAFDTIGGEVVKPSLLIMTNQPPSSNAIMATLDVSELNTTTMKSIGLMKNSLQMIFQKQQKENPDHRISVESINNDIPLLSKYADSYWGIGTGDTERFACRFWEINPISTDWVFFQGTFPKTDPYTGREHILYWQKGSGELYRLAEELKLRLKNIWQRGSQAWKAQVWCGSTAKQVNSAGKTGYSACASRRRQSNTNRQTLAVTSEP